MHSITYNDKFYKAAVYTQIKGRTKFQKSFPVFFHIQVSWESQKNCRSSDLKKVFDTIHYYRNFLLYTTEYCYLITTFQCLSYILITSCWLCTARWSTWPGNHPVPCVAELVGSCNPIHAYRGFPDPKCLFIYLVCRCASLSTTFAFSQSMTWFSSTAWSVMADLWVTLLSLAL